MAIESTTHQLERASWRVRMRGEAREDAWIGVGAIVLVVALVSYVLIRALARRLLARVDSARSQVRDRIEALSRW